MTAARPAQVRNDLVRILGATSVSLRAADVAWPAMSGQASRPDPSRTSRRCNLNFACRTVRAGWPREGANSWKPRGRRLQDFGCRCRSGRGGHVRICTGFVGASSERSKIRCRSMYSGTNTRESEETISLVQPMRFECYEVVAGRSISTRPSPIRRRHAGRKPLAGSKAYLTKLSHDRCRCHVRAAYS